MNKKNLIYSKSNIIEVIKKKRWTNSLLIKKKTKMVLKIFSFKNK